jgi:hypothetical protein
LQKGASSPGAIWNSVAYATFIYASIALAFTGLGILIGPQEAQVGGTRPGDTIPGHLVELAAFGLLLGLGCMVIYGKKGIPLVFLTSILTVLLDIDHLPAYMGLAEPIRPAHSLVFIIVALAATAVTIKAFDIDLIVVSAFMGHMAVDTGLFAPFSPISFDYVQLDPYRLPFALGAILCALAAGVILRRRQGTIESGGPKSTDQALALGNRGPTTASRRGSSVKGKQSRIVER